MKAKINKSAKRRTTAHVYPWDLADVADELDSFAEGIVDGKGSRFLAHDIGCVMLEWVHARLEQDEEVDLSIIEDLWLLIGRYNSQPGLGRRWRPCSKPRFVDYDHWRTSHAKESI